MNDHCPGLNNCNEKGCIEQDRCLNVHLLQSYWSQKGKLKSVTPDTPAPCQQIRAYCNKKNVCEILGQCILDHPLVKADKMASKQLRGNVGTKTIIKIIERLMPSLKRIGKRRLYNR